MAPGGQAGTSSKIENYLGFPTGISGQALAGRAQVQAQKFGARLALSRAVVGLDCERAPYTLKLEDGESIARPRHRHRHRRALPQARRRRLRALRRRRASTTRRRRWRRPLRRAGDRRRRRRQLGRPGRRLPRPQREARAHAVSRQGPGGDDVGLPGAADRALGPRSPCIRIPRSARSPATPRCRASPGPIGRAANATTRPARSIFVMIGAEPNTRMGGGLPRARRAGLHLHRRQSRSGCRFTLRDVARRRLRGRRRPLGVGQARRLRRRRRLGRGPGDPSLPEPGAGVTGQ